MARMQFLDRNHLLIKYGLVDIINVRVRVPPPSEHGRRDAG